MKATVTIDLSSPQAQQFLLYARTLPFAEVVEEQKTTFEEAVEACNGRPVAEFIDELRRQVKEHYRRA